MLRGHAITAEERTRDEETGRVSVRRISTGGMEVPTWGVGSFGGPVDPRQGGPGGNFDRSGRGSGEWGQFRQVGPGQQGVRNAGGNERFRSRAQSQPQTQVRALAPTGTAPADVEHQRSATLLTAERDPLPEGVYKPAEMEEPVPIMKTLRIYPFGVNRDRLTESARQLRVPIIVTNNQGDADAVITLKNYYRRQPERLQQAEQDRKLIIILKNNTVAQMQHALAHIFDIPTADAPSDDDDEAESDSKGSDDSTTRALLETEDAIHQVLNKGLTTAELAPANAYIRRLQHQMATRYNLISRSRGKEPYRRVKIFRSRD